MRRVFICMLLGLCGVLFASAQTHRERAERMLVWLKANATDSIYAHLNTKMSSLVQKSQLEGMWSQLEQQAGPMESEGDWQQDVLQGVVVYYKDIQFRQAPLRFVVAFDPDGKANTLRLMPVPPEVKPAEAVFDSLRLEERSIEIVSGNYRLPGTLTLPRNSQSVPLVVLVHGSGPQDRDVTIGPNKVFRDLAWGLAEQGIGVLRYDKRTYIYKEASVPEGVEITPREEVLDDALAAIQLAATIPEVDGERIFLAGHSLGGLLAPQLATESYQLRGIIVMAAPTRPLEMVADAQIRYIASLNGPVSEEEVQQQLHQLWTSAPASYWTWLEDYQPVMTAYRLQLPMLFLQGERDYQVTMEDFAFWRLGLYGKTNATFKSYPSLNHCFMEGEGKSTPMEYNHPSRFSKQVISDMADWIKRE